MPRSATVLVYHPTEAQRYAALVRAPHGRVPAPHGRVLAPHGRVLAPSGRVRMHVASTPEQAAPVIGDVDVLFAWGFPRALYAQASRLAWLQTMGAGVEWALVPELPARVVVTRAPGVFGPWMAEYVIGWIASITQRIATYRAMQQRREWDDTVIPVRLAGKTLVLVGLGDIGRVIARSARALGLRVLGVSRSGRPAPNVERTFRVRDLPRALALADFAVVVLPLTPETRGLVGERELQALRPHAWLLNIGRGAVIDEAALVRTLQEKRIAGAVLDVVATEPLPQDHPLWTLDNVAITPHISGPSTPDELTPVFNDNLARWLAGRRLRHVVDRARGY